MAKVFNYTVILVGIVVALNVFGAPTFTSKLLDVLNYDNGDALTSELFNYLLSTGGILIASIAAISIGYLTKQSTESIIVAGFAGALAGWTITDLLFVKDYISDICAIDCVWAANGMSILIWGLIAGYAIAIISWWRGAD